MRVFGKLTIWDPRHKWVASRVNCALASMLVLAFGILLLSPFAEGRPASQPAPAAGPMPAGLKISLVTEPRQPTVGDLIRIDLAITHPEDTRISFPAPGERLGEFFILEFYPGPTVPPLPSSTHQPAKTAGQQAEDLKTHHRARIVAALYNVGEFEFPPLPMSLRDASGKEITFLTPAFKIKVQSILADKNPNLKNLKKQAEIEEPVRWLLWLSIALLLLLLAAVLGWLWRRSHHPALSGQRLPDIDPLDAAEAELRDLLSRGFLNKGFIKEFYVALSDIVRKILEAGYSIPTMERTTEEIMGELCNGEELRCSYETFREIETMLTDCDMVKFAKYIPSGIETDSTVKRAFQVLQVCRTRNTQSVATVAVTGDGGA